MIAVEPGLYAPELRDGRAAGEQLSDHQRRRRAADAVLAGAVIPWPVQGRALHRLSGRPPAGAASSASKART